MVATINSRRQQTSLIFEPPHTGPRGHKTWSLHRAPKRGGYVFGKVELAYLARVDERDGYKRAVEACHIRGAGGLLCYPLNEWVVWANDE